MDPATVAIHATLVHEISHRESWAAKTFARAKTANKKAELNSPTLAHSLHPLSTRTRLITPLSLAPDIEHSTIPVPTSQSSAKPRLLARDAAYVFKTSCTYAAFIGSRRIIFPVASCRAAAIAGAASAFAASDPPP